MKTLVVDDDFSSRKILQSIFASYGECHVAVDGKEAIFAFEQAFFEEEPYDVICLDIMMPEMDGQEVLKRIRDFETNHNIFGSDGVKIIMTTALDDNEHIIQAFRDQCEAYLIKPINKSKLLSILADFDTELNSMHLIKLLNDYSVSYGMDNDGEKSIEGVENNEPSIPTMDMNADTLTSEKETSFAREMDDYLSNSSNKASLVNSKMAIVDRLVSEFGFSSVEANELFDNFVEFLSKFLYDADMSVAEHNFISLRQLAHQLKGTSANLNILDIETLCKKLETACDNQDINLCQQILSQIEKIFKS
jgi:two-component system chemotaxis response regulator CheY